MRSMLERIKVLAMGRTFACNSGAPVCDGRAGSLPLHNYLETAIHLLGRLNFRKSVMGSKSTHSRTSI